MQYLKKLLRKLLCWLGFSTQQPHHPSWESFMATLDDILAIVQAQDTALDSVRQLISGLKQQVADLLAGTVLPESVQAKVNEVFAAAEKNSAEIAEALAENVPTEPSP